MTDAASFHDGLPWLPNAPDPKPPKTGNRWHVLFVLIAAIIVAAVLIAYVSYRLGYASVGIAT